MSETTDPGPVYEPDPQPVDWERLCQLRGIGAIEADDLAEWYDRRG